MQEIIIEQVINEITIEATGPAGRDGNNGLNGKSAYQEALDSGFVGTVQEWLDFLQGIQGEQGIQGIKGDDGSAATITIGTTTTLNAGQQATVQNVGTTQAAILNFGIPKGADGSGGGTSLFNIDANKNVIGSDKYSSSGARNVILTSSNFNNINVSGYANVLIGKDAGTFIGGGHDNILIGEQTAYSSTVNNCIAIGTQSQSNKAQDGNIGIGGFTLNRGVGANNIAMGFFTMFDHSYNNCVGIGNGVEASGNNEIQLGDSSQTVYSFAPLQIRSDLRDKTEIRPCSKGLDFILSLEPIDYKWNPRKDYIERIVTEYYESEINEKGEKVLVKKYNVEFVEHENDGSKTRNRFHHGLPAQSLADKDFGGFQDHSINGGEDVMTLAYEEFIAPLIKAIQEQQKMINDLKEEIALLKK